MEEKMEEARAAIAAVAEDASVDPASAIALMQELKDFIDECIDALEAM